MAGTTLSTGVLIRRIIESGNFDKEKLLFDMDILLLGGRLTPDDYAELAELLETQEPDVNED